MKLHGVVTAARKASIRGRANVLAGTLCATALAPSTAHAVTVTTLYDFCARVNCADGAQSGSALIQDKAGTLFGTTAEGGASNLAPQPGKNPMDRASAVQWAGARRRIRADPRGNGSAVAVSGALQLLLAGRLRRRLFPYSTLAIDKSENLYGTTRLGGTGVAGNNGNGGGTAFALSPAPRPPWPETVLYSFCQAVRPCLQRRFRSGARLDPNG